MAKGDNDAFLGQMHAQKGERRHNNPATTLSPRLLKMAASVVDSISRAPGGEATTSYLLAATRTRGFAASGGQVERILRALEVSGKVQGHKGKGETETRWTLRAGQEQEPEVQQEEFAVSVRTATIGFLLTVRHTSTGKGSSVPLRPGYTDADRESAQERAMANLLRILGRAA